MAKKKSTSSRDKRVGRQRAAAESRRQAQEYEGVPEEIVELLESPYTLPEWERFYRTFPTVTAAVEAVRRGETVEVYSSEHELFLMRVILVDGDPVVETVLYVPYGTRDALWSGLLHSDDRENALKRIIDVLPGLLPDDVRVDGIHYAVEAPPAGAQLPRFAYRYRIPADGLDTWKSHTEASRRFDALHEAVGWMDTRAACHADAVQILRRHGLPAVSCDACGHAVTNRHPAWPGLWVDFMGDECGPLCPEWDDSALETESELDSLAIGGPHQVNDAALSAR
ncbi:hypothetical protein [Amycolatopsis sp. KNN50.9b]|uniref:hypothetical protein n=1 Tax=Amycolatopsis sp. KNN50.9b TaxID=2018303 RepID=UPI000B8AEB44|nr:hypothetical protein [Amycolatopsis sp. KNN50.9b]OXM60328.1 hypothetical protein CF166_35235 [Amycolatopsis sp. KNN50.9b]